jgi:hypothetical protein
MFSPVGRRSYFKMTAFLIIRAFRSRLAARSELRRPLSIIRAEPRRLFRWFLRYAAVAS